MPFAAGLHCSKHLRRTHVAVSPHAISHQTKVDGIPGTTPTLTASPVDSFGLWTVWVIGSRQALLAWNTWKRLDLSV